MSDQSAGETERSATSEGIKEWEEENDEPHPVFEVPHRPERESLNDTEHYAELFQSRHFDETVEIWCPQRDEEKVVLGRYYVEYCPMCGENIAGWFDGA